MILLADSDVEVHAEPHAEDVEAQVAALHRRCALALEVADLERIDRPRLPEEVPRGLARAVMSRKSSAKVFA